MLAQQEAQSPIRMLERTLHLWGIIFLLFFFLRLLGVCLHLGFSFDLINLVKACLA
jgi:hypothetical protein